MFLHKKERKDKMMSSLFIAVRFNFVWNRKLRTMGGNIPVLH
jgi:hypothetical protein